MDTSLTFSFEVRIVIARLARLVRKYDHLRTGLSNEEDIMHLLEVAVVHPRPEVQSIFDEMCYIMTDEELQCFADQGLTLPEAYAKRLQGGSGQKPSQKKPRMMYRGRVVEG